MVYKIRTHSAPDSRSNKLISHQERFFFTDLFDARSHDQIWTKCELSLTYEQC